MDLKQWKDIVVEWVNCLNLTDKIDSLSDLKDGTFVFNLIKLFEFETPATECDFSSIKNILSRQYPNCHFENQDAELVQDLSDKDLLLLASLLLHYSCIVDRRDLFISPLCNNLSQNSQICIRSFLELVKNRFSRKELFNVIQLCVGKLPSSTSLRCYALQAGDSVLTSCSPLQEFLKTPAKRPNRLQEKDREISKLLHTIDLERFEKDDLQAEVNLQKERNKKLRQQMDEKTAEMIKLRNEIAELENQSMVHENLEAREVQQRLRGEVSSLEKYVQQLEEEQEQLQNERDFIKNDLKKVEMQLSLWHEKAISAEHSCDNLLEKQQELEVELVSYKSQCMELNALLKELHPKKHLNESSIEVDMSVSDVLQTLNETHGEAACAVIDIQFKDVQKENVELKSLLKQCQDSLSKLQEELNITNGNYNKLNEDFDHLQVNNRELLKKVVVLEETQDSLKELQIKFEKSKAEISIILDCNSTLTNTCSTLQTQLNEKEDNLNSLNSELINLKQRYENYEIKYVEKSYVLISLEKEFGKLQAKFDKLTNDYVNANFNLTSVVENFQTFDTNMESNLHRLEKIVFGGNNLDMKDKPFVFTQSLEKLEQNNAEHAKEKKAMGDNITDFENLVEKLHVDLNDLNQKQNLNLVERKNLTDHLKFANEKINNLETAIVGNLRKIETSNSTISEMQTTISELEVLNKVIKENEDTISNLNSKNLSLQSKLENNLVLQNELRNCIKTTEAVKASIKCKLIECQNNLSQCKDERDMAQKEVVVLKHSVKAFEAQIADTTAQLQQLKDREKEMQEEILHLQEVKMRLTDINNQLEDQGNKLKLSMFEQSKQHQEEIKCLNTKVDTYLLKINSLESELNISQINCSNLKKHLDAELMSKQKLEEEIQLCKEDFNKRLNIVTTTVNQVQSDLSKAKDNEKTLKAELERSLLKFEGLQSESNLKDRKCLKLEEELEKVSNELNHLEALHSNDKDQLSMVNEKLMFLKLEIDEKSQELTNLKADSIERQLTLKAHEEVIENLNKELEKSRQEIEELQGERLILENLNSALQQKCDQLEINSKNTILNLSKKNDQLNSEILKYLEYRQSTETEILDLRSKLALIQSQVEEMEEVKNTTASETKQQITVLQKTITCLHEEIDSLKKVEIEHVIEVRNTQEELSEAISKYTESLQLRQELERENETQVNSLTENLHEVVEKYNRIDKVYADTMVELQSARKSLEVLQNCKIQLEVEMMEQKEKYEADHKKCISELNVHIAELTTKEADLNLQLQDLRETCKTSESNCESLHTLSENLNLELDLLKVEKSNILSRLQAMQGEHKEFKDLNNALRQDYISFIKNHCTQLEELKVEFLRYLTTLSFENQELKMTIKTINDMKGDCENKQKEAVAMYMDELQQKEMVINKLKVDVNTLEKHVSKLSEEKAILDKLVSEQKENLSQCKNQSDNIISEKDSKIEEYLTNIVQLKSACKILETGKLSFEEEISSLIEKIKQIEEEKLANENNYVAEVNGFEETINELKWEIGGLQTQLLNNVGKSNKLELELSTTTDSLNTLNAKHLGLEKFLSEKEKEHGEKLQQIEVSATAKQVLIENLEQKNESLTQEISRTKEEIENLKKTINSSLLERQSLNLQIETLSEKLLSKDSLIKQHESTVNETNEKLLRNLSEILDIEKEKRILQEKLEEVSAELQESKKHRDEILDSQTKIIKETENNLIKAHEHVTEVKEDLSKRIQSLEDENENEMQMRIDVQKLLDIEKVAKEMLEIRVLELTNENSKFSQVYLNLKNCVDRISSALDNKSLKVIVKGEEKEFKVDDLNALNTTIEEIQGRILEIIVQHEKCSKEIQELENEKVEITRKIEEVNLEKNLLNQEREKLLCDYNAIYNEKMEIDQQNNDYNALKIKYEQLMGCNKNNEALTANHRELEEKVESLEAKINFSLKTCNKYANLSSNCSAEVDQLLCQRSIIDEILAKLKTNLSTIQTKVLYVSDIKEHGRLNEQIESFNFIIEDIYKQYLRCSKKIQNIVSTVMQFSSEIYNVVSSENLNDTVEVQNKFDFNEELEKVTDCKDRASDLLEQMTTFLDMLNKKVAKVQKENILQCSQNGNVELKVTDEELKKKNMNLKQRLTLTENAKNNLEKKVKQLREEIKNTHFKSNITDQEISYKKLLREHIQTKEEFERTVKRNEEKYKSLAEEYKQYKSESISNQTKAIKLEQNTKFDIEMVKLREAYRNLMGDNSRLSLEIITLQKLLEDRNSELGESRLIKEAYEKILEENNKLKLEIDTALYKKRRDREDLEQLRKENSKKHQNLQEIRNEYEGKLEKMKQKMVQLYRDEFNKEIEKQKLEQHEKIDLLNTIEKLQQSLKVYENERRKQPVQVTNDKHGCEFCSSRDSMSSVTDSIRFGRQDTLSFKAPEKAIMEWNSAITQRKPREDKKSFTLPRSISEDSRRNTIQPPLGQKLEMEDEEDDPFNNKYLADLKEGCCILPSGRESNTSRLSELKWRNSMCPPHLKSSYPAETQFNSPKQFKEEDIKSGVVEFDDSMSTRLIPGEKPRKKDIGTTSYKKPGPPTPSKNGGRMSLQGNEIHPRDILRDNIDSKTPKRSTPKATLKSLFMGRNSSVRDNSENHPPTPKSKRLSIFRKQR